MSFSDNCSPRAEEKILRRKLDRNLIPLVFISYMLAFLDRSNIGNAYTAGMGSDLHLSSSQYQWLLTIFYISYLLFQVAVLFWKLFDAPTVAFALTTLWGIISMLQATAQNWSSLMAARFFIGAVEASFAPGIAFYLSQFYPRQEFGARFAVYASASALASSFAGALAFAIVHAHGTSIADWRLLFIVEGAPTVLFAPFLYRFLPNNIQDCKFLTTREKDLATMRMQDSTTNAPAPGSSSVPSEAQRDTNPHLSKIDWDQVFEALKDPTNYVAAVMFFIANVTYGSLPVYLPTILKDAGFSAVRAQGLSAPPYLVTFCCAIGFSMMSDRFRHRGLFVSGLSATAGIGYVVLATQSSQWVRYGASFLVAIGSFSIVPLLYTWVSNNAIEESQRGAGFAIFAVIGQCGPLLGTRLFPSEDAPLYVTGMSTGAGLLFSASLISLGLSGYYTHLNRKLSRSQATSLPVTPPQSPPNNAKHWDDQKRSSTAVADEESVVLPSQNGLGSRSPRENPGQWESTRFRYYT